MHIKNYIVKFIVTLGVLGMALSMANIQTSSVQASKVTHYRAVPKVLRGYWLSKKTDEPSGMILTQHTFKTGGIESVSDMYNFDAGSVYPYKFKLANSGLITCHFNSKNYRLKITKDSKGHYFVTARDYLFSGYTHYHLIKNHHHYILKSSRGSYVKISSKK